jgi:DNA (cytosine-5)-methyltransferase 1
MRHGSLFSGIGGFDLAAEWMGWENVFHCEINPFGQRVLKYYWPDAELFTDITKTDFKPYANRIDILSGGFPCQPYSTAGKRLGKEDERHLWPEMLRAIREIRPRWIVGENVLGITNWNRGLVFNEVQADLEVEGYEIIPFILPAVGVNANNIRTRVFFIGYSSGLGCEDVQDHFSTRKEKRSDTGGNWKEIEREQETIELDSPGNSFLQFEQMYSQPPVFDVNDGLPFELDGITVPKWIEESIKAGGNSVNPILVNQIFKAIELYETETR